MRAKLGWPYLAGDITFFSTSSFDGALSIFLRLLRYRFPVHMMIFLQVVRGPAELSTIADNHALVYLTLVRLKR